MEIYHGSIEIVRTPEIRIPERTLDYGTGFYTTTDIQQAADWVLRHKKDKKKPSTGYVNIYEVDMDQVRSGRCLWFDAPNAEWVDFVDANRNNRKYEHDYDFVYGPVANDKVYAAFALYEAGLLNKQDLIREMKAYTLVDQLLFHTPQALRLLSFKNVMEVPL